MYIWLTFQSQRIRFLAFVLIKLEAAKQCSKKRKESGADDKDNASTASSPPPQAKKSKIVEPQKRVPANIVGSPERSSLFSGKNDNNDFTDTPEYKDSDEDMEDSIVVGEKVDLQPVKKTNAGDPFTYIRGLHKPHMLDPSSPSPAPKPDRKPATKPAGKEASGLKLNVSVPARSQGSKQGRKASDNTARAIEAIEVPQPTTKVVSDKMTSKEPVAKNQEKPKIVGGPKSAKQTTTADPQDKAIQDHSEGVAPEQEEKADMTSFGTTGNPLDEHHEDDTGPRSPDSTDFIYDFASAADAPDADGVQATVETDHVRTEPDAIETAPVAVKAPPKSASSLSTDPVAKRSEAPSSEISLGPTNNIAAPVTATAALNTRLYMFIITVVQPEDPSTDIDSLCLTFAPTTTNWASFYCNLAMQLPVEDRVTFARATTCKIRVPRQGQRKSRWFSFDMKPAAVETMWANFMRMVAGLGDDSEPVEVEFFP
jgi:hypothetical protein